MDIQRKPKPPAVRKKRVRVSLVVDEDNLGAIQRFYGGTPAEAMTKFIETQLCKQAQVESLEVKRFVSRCS